MLVLSRKVGERIMIGDNICVVVTKIRGDQVTLGFEAPNEGENRVPIRRAELPELPQEPTQAVA